MKSRKFCPLCGRPLYKSNIKGYVFQCYACDEDFYRFEVFNTRQIELVRIIREIEYLDGLAKGIFMPTSYKKPYPRPEPTKHQKINDHGRNPKNHPDPHPTRQTRSR